MYLLGVWLGLGMGLGVCLRRDRTRAGVALQSHTARGRLTAHPFLSAAFGSTSRSASRKRASEQRVAARSGHQMGSVAVRLSAVLRF